MSTQESLIQTIKDTAWHSDWSGPFPLLEVSIASKVYFDGLQTIFGKSLSRFFVHYRNGIAFARLPEQEYIALGRYLGEQLTSVDTAKQWAQAFKDAADAVTPTLQLSAEEFLASLPSLVPLHERYGAYNVGTKIVFDVMVGSLSTEIKQLLEDARRYSETFYKDNTKMFEQAADLIEQQSGYTREHILMMTRDELTAYSERKELPSKDILSSRYEYCGVYTTPEGMYFLSGIEMADIEKYWASSNDGKTLKGSIAYPGKVVGICRIILDYKAATLEQGEILVTGMTDPNFVPLMKNAAAIVTDGGGMLSHAAIVSRELKKPCVVGTKIATQILKDGDRVEVDATAGIVRII